MVQNRMAIAGGEDIRINILGARPMDWHTGQEQVQGPIHSVTEMRWQEEA